MNCGFLQWAPLKLPAASAHPWVLGAVLQPTAPIIHPPWLLPLLWLPTQTPSVSETPPSLVRIPVAPSPFPGSPNPSSQYSLATAPLCKFLRLRDPRCFPLFSWAQPSSPSFTPPLAQPRGCTWGRALAQPCSRPRLLGGRGA